MPAAPGTRIEIPFPDDWHIHLRDGEGLNDAAPHAAERFGRAIIMPNLKPPVATVDQAQAYRDRILAALPAGAAFEPLMTLYLTDQTAPEEIVRAKQSGFVHGVKLYPAGATTNSDAGVTGIESLAPTLEAMQKHDVVLQIHGESTDPDIDVFDRERVFLEGPMAWIADNFPELRIVFEHITTREAVDFVRARAREGCRIGATITVHHLLLNRNAIFQGGIRPHHYCLPILKRESHREALVAAATGGEPQFFAGTDSAPHPRHLKENACGCAGVYSAYGAVELYAEVFDEAGKLEAFDGAVPEFEGFMSRNGPGFYGLPVHERRMRLIKEPFPIPELLRFGADELVPLRAGGQAAWRIEA